MWEDVHEEGRTEEAPGTSPALCASSPPLTVRLAGEAVRHRRQFISVFRLTHLVRRHWCLFGLRTDGYAAELTLTNRGHKT